MNLNVGIQIQLWRVTTFHKMHCVIDYTFVVIDYQWTVLKKKLRVITLNMVFLKSHNSSNGFFDQTWRVYKSMTLAHIQKRHMIFFQTILFHNLSLTIAHCFFFAKKLSKLCFKTLFLSASGNFAENKSVLSFHPNSLFSVSVFFFSFLFVLWIELFLRGAL